MAHRVLHVVGAMNRGGAETMLMSTYRYLKRDQLQFDFLEFEPSTSDYAAEIESLGGRIIKTDWSRHPRGWYSAYQGLVRLLTERDRYLAVHSHVLFASSVALLAARRASVPIRIAHSHTTSDGSHTISRQIYRFVSRAVIQRIATKFVACSADAGHFLFGRRWFDDHGVVIRNAVDTKVFRPPIQYDYALGSVGGHVGRPSLICVARLEAVKNHAFLLDLAECLRDRGKGFSMLFVGEGSLHEQLSYEISHRGLQGLVRMLGKREDVSDMMRVADFLLLPSHYEGLPVSLVEAQASGLACLISDNVTSEVDLGLGLVQWLSTSDVGLWADAIDAGASSTPSGLEVGDALSAAGYSVEDSVHAFQDLYQNSNRRA